MGALSFNYTVFPKPKVSTKFFEYKWNTPLSEYRFNYERYAALSDASIFNAPVAVVKVATGVCLYDLFVEKNEKNTAYLQNSEPATHVITGNINDSEFVKRILISNTNDKDIFLYKVIGPIPWTSEILHDVHENHTLYMPGTLEITDTHFDYTIQSDAVYSFIPPHWKADTVEFTVERIPWDPGTITMFYQDAINRPQRYYTVSPNEMETILNTEKPITANVHLMYRIERTGCGNFRIYPNETAVRIKDNNFEILRHGKPLFAQIPNYGLINRLENFFVYRDPKFSMKLFKSYPTDRKIYDICLDEPFNVSKDMPVITLIDTALFGNRQTYDMNVASLEHQATINGKRIYHDIEDIGLASPTKNINIMNGFNLAPPTKNISIMNGFNLAPQIKHANDTGSFDIAKKDKDTNDMNNFINVTQPDIKANIIKQMNLIRQILIASVFKNIILDREQYKTSIFSQLYSFHKGANGYQNIIFSTDMPHAALIDKRLYYQSYDNLGWLVNKKTNTNLGASGSKTENSSFTSYFNNDLVSKFDNRLFEASGYHLFAYNKIVCELSLADFSIQEQKYAITLDGISVAQQIKDLTKFQEIWLNTHSEYTDAISTQVNAEQFRKDIIDEEWIRLGAGKVQSGSKSLEIGIFFGEKNHNSGTYDMFVFGLGDKPLSPVPHNTLIGISKNGKGHSFSIYKDMVVFGAKADNLLSLYPNMLPIHKEEVSILIWPDQNPITKIKYGLNIQNSGKSVEKSRYPFRLDNTTDLVTKIRHGMSVHECGTSIYKKRKGVNLDIAIIWSAYKIRHSMVIDTSGEHIYKIPKNLFMDNAGNIVHKTRHPMSILPNVDSVYKDAHDFSIRENFENVIKTAYKAVVSHYLKYPNWECYDGFIVPISKVRHQGMIDYVNELAKKRYRDSMITEGTFGSVLAKPGMIEPGVTIDKLARPAFLDYLNEMAVKSRLKATIEEGSFGFKRPHNIQIQYEEPWGCISHKSVQTEEDILGQTSPVKGFLYADEWTSKDTKSLITSNGVFGDKSPQQAEVFDDEWLRKAPLLCYYSYDLWGVKEGVKVFLTPQEMAAQNVKEVYVDGYLMGSKDNTQSTIGSQNFAEKEQYRAMIQFGDFATTGISNAWYEYGVFTDRLIRTSAIANELNGVFKDIHKCDLHPNDFGNWAWVYETPDPFQYDKYGIDELLLPEKDTQYEHFENLIFDREHMRPRNAIKEISETQWIARLPIRHPVDKWKDVGKVYEDSAIKWENYFGIQSSVIHDMFLKYYRIWEKYMFKFSTMTMQQAGNLMLEYLWDWIPLYYPIDQIEQAYRAFRLVRWYTECAIINNSQYIISYEYANLTWPDADHKGICHIPSDLQEYDPTNIVDNSNDTMYSDTAPGHLCLRNNPIYTRSNDIWVTFKIKNKRNTTITFSLYNQIGSVNIYLNDKLIDIVSAHGSQRLAYNIPYTGDTNEFKIEKKAADNLDNNFIVGNISIVNQAFKDLKIDFDPALRAGNKPLNEVAQKLLEFVALHDRKDIAYHEMITKNLAVSEVYKMLAKYWQLHHENKWKGKRLIIKKV